MSICLSIQVRLLEFGHFILALKISHEMVVFTPNVTLSSTISDHRVSWFSNASPTVSSFVMTSLSLSLSLFEELEGHQQKTIWSKGSPALPSELVYLHRRLSELKKKPTYTYWFWLSGKNLILCCYTSWWFSEVLNDIFYKFWAEVFFSIQNIAS